MTENEGICLVPLAPCAVKSSLHPCICTEIVEGPEIDGNPCHIIPKKTRQKMIKKSLEIVSFVAWHCKDKERRAVTLQKIYRVKPEKGEA